VRRVEIDKPGSMSKRPLGIPTIMDRVAQQAVVNVLEPVFEPGFSEVSFGFRPGRSTHGAMECRGVSGQWVCNALNEE
jgi:RNA-directed DNA polymerase